MSAPSLAGARAVVTGSAGFIGAHLVEALAERGAAVIGIDRRAMPVRAPGRHLCVDLVDPGTDALLHDVLGDADLVFHLAARPGVRGTGPDIELVRRRDNVDATRNVLACTPGDVPVVVTSSSSVYGGARIVGGVLRPSHESDELHPLGGYAGSKVAVEQLCASRADAGGIVTVVRPFSVVGECQRSDMAITRWLRAAVAGAPLQILGSPDRSRDFTDVADVVRALVVLGMRGETTTVNVGTGRSHTLSEVVRAVGDAVGREMAIEVAPAGTEEPHATRAHAGRCERVCGFVPETDLVDVVHRQLDQALTRAA